MEALISVVIPTYNHAHFIRRAIQSVLDQTYTNWEILVVDNHSSDNTEGVIKNLNDGRIQLLKIHNSGVIGMSRNMGILKAKGDWIAFLDSDDCWYPNKLDIVMKVACQDNKYDVLSTHEMMVDKKTGLKTILRHGPFQENFYKVLLTEGNRLSPSATLIRHSFLKQHKLLFNESKNYIAVEDYDLWLHLALKGARFKFIDSVQGEYTIHSGNNSAQLLRQIKNVETLLHHHVFKLQKFNKNSQQLWDQFRPMLNAEKIKQLLSDGDFFQACLIILNVLFSHPFQFISYIYNKIIRKKRAKNY